MRIYSDKALNKCITLELECKLAMVKSSDELTTEEKKANIDKIGFYLNGKVKYAPENVLNDILASQADLHDMEA